MKDAILKMYNKKTKKSIHFLERMDIFLLLAILVLLISPVVINFVLRLDSAIKVKDIYLSARFEEFFGKEITEKLTLDFMEQNPDLRVRLINPSPSSAGAQNQKSAQDKISVPDIIIFDEGAFSSLVDGEMLKPFESDSEKGEGQLAIPLVSFMDLLFYNIELLKAAGFDRPPKTREEFLAYAKTVSGGNSGILANAAGAAISLSPDDAQALSRDIFSWIWAAGGDFWQEGENPIINNRSMVRDISFLGSLYREGALAPDIFETTGEKRLEEFARGKIAMMTASTRSIPALREKMGDGAFGVTNIPGSGSAGKYGAGLTGFYAGISVTCKYHDRAREFLLFLAEHRPLLCAELKAVPGDAAQLIPGEYMRDDPYYSKAREIFESSQIVSGFYGKAGAQKFERAVLEEMRIFFESGRTAEQTAVAIQQRWLEE
jgi:ABC-type glycerol-3-phosphate transport system substrate-binding protein